ncbi:ABC transporter permease [Flavitalea sp.]|nr:ABC transporter permease [Flavitalea sp.]
MFRNYLNSSLRNLSKNRLSSIINISGLAVGIAAALLIFFVVQFETSFDSFHKKRNNIYRITSTFSGLDGLRYSGNTSFPVAPQLRLDFPQVEEVASIFRQGDGQINAQSDKTKQEQKFQEKDIFYSEPGFFQMFDFEWLAGSPETALSQPNSVVLTQELADKYFGTWKVAIGKTIRHNNRFTYKISGILKNVPENTDFPLSVIISYETLKSTDYKESLKDWIGTYHGAYTFVVLSPSYGLNKFQADLKAFSKKYKPAQNAGDLFNAQPLAEMHYDERFGNYRTHTFSHQLVSILSLIAIFLIGIACVNFINLATAHAVNRSKEVGVRKVLGSSRGQLTFQFLSESLLITVAAFAIAIGISITALPFLNQLLATSMTAGMLLSPTVINLMVILVLLITILSGLYPAIIMSGFKPVTALKGKISSKMVGGISLRRSLVVLQFSIAQILIIGMLIVVKQTVYFKDAPLGFDRSYVVNVPIANDSANQSKTNAFVNRLRNHPGIENISLSYASPSSEDNWTSKFRFNQSTHETDFGANLKWADADYFKTYRIEFVGGRQYYASDTIREYVVNETLAKKLGYLNPSDILGKTINFGSEGEGIPIIGVVRDFNALSLKQPMSPVVLSTWNGTYQVMNIRVKPETQKATLVVVEKLWKETYPDKIFSYSFLDDTIDSFYKQENQLSILYKVFAGIALFISCLGLYGLVMFIATQRTKEVGIRKVLGASTSSIVYLLSREFILLIVLAFVIASPVAYYFMHNWLQNYTYRIQPGYSIFLFAFIGCIVVGWLTVGHRAMKAAKANPAKSLKTDG